MNSSDGLVKRRVASSSNSHHANELSSTDRGKSLHSKLDKAANPSSSSSSSSMMMRMNDNERDLFDTDEYPASSLTANRFRQNEAAGDMRLSLLEEVFLLGIKDKEGYTSFWNDCISLGLRGCILAELVLRKRICLEKTSVSRRRSSLSSRLVQVISSERTGDALLDEALKHITETQPAESLYSWIHYLSGETWNPFYLRFQLKNVRERIAKNLAEKGVLSTEKRNFFIFDMTTHPLVNSQVKSKLIQRVQDALLSKYVNDALKMDKRLLALIMLAHHSDVLENAFCSLSDDSDYELAINRVRTLLELDMESLSAKPEANEALWAVFMALAK